MSADVDKCINLNYLGDKITLNHNGTENCMQLNLRVNFVRCFLFCGMFVTLMGQEQKPEKIIPVPVIGMSENYAIAFADKYQAGDLLGAKEMLAEHRARVSALTTGGTKTLRIMDTTYYWHVGDVERNQPFRKFTGAALTYKDAEKYGQEEEYWGLKSSYIYGAPEFGRVYQYFNHPLILKEKATRLAAEKRREETSKEINQSKNVFSLFGNIVKGVVKEVAYAVKDVAVGVVDAFKDQPRWPGKYYEMSLAGMNYSLNLALMNDYTEAATVAAKYKEVYDEIGGRNKSLNAAFANQRRELTESSEIKEARGDGDSAGIDFALTGNESVEEWAAKLRSGKDGKSGDTYLAEVRKFDDKAGESLNNTYEVATSYLVSSFISTNASKNSMNDSSLPPDEGVNQENIKASKALEAGEYTRRAQNLGSRYNSSVNSYQGLLASTGVFMPPAPSEQDANAASPQYQEWEQAYTAAKTAGGKDLTDTLIIVETGSISGVDTAKYTVPYYNKETKTPGLLNVVLPRIAREGKVWDPQSLLLTSIPSSGAPVSTSKVAVGAKKGMKPQVEKGNQQNVNLYETDNLDALLKKQFKDEMPGRVIDSALSVYLQYKFQVEAFKKINDSKNNDTNKFLLKLVTVAISYAISSGDLDTDMWRTLPSRIYTNRIWTTPGKNKLTIRTPDGALKTVDLNIDKKADIIHIRLFPNEAVVKTGNKEEFELAEGGKLFVNKDLIDVLGQAQEAPTKKQ